MKEKIKKIYSLDYTRVYNQTEFNYVRVGSEGYGETGFDSIENIISGFSEFFNRSTVFYDIGSGLGKIVFHVGLLHNPKKATGIEYSKERHDFSLKIIKDFEIENENIQFVNANVLELDISDATVIYVDNTLFPKHINSSIYEMIPNGCLVISRQRFTESLKNQEMIKKFLPSVMTNYGTNSIFFFIKK